ncbi:hypothetical protein GCM10023097_08210 [Streptomyces collinus]
MDCSWDRWALTFATGMSGAAAALEGAEDAASATAPPVRSMAVAMPPAATARAETESFMWGLRIPWGSPWDVHGPPTVNGVPGW